MSLDGTVLRPGLTHKLPFGSVFVSASSSGIESIGLDKEDCKCGGQLISGTFSGIQSCWS